MKTTLLLSLLLLSLAAPGVRAQEAAPIASDAVLELDCFAGAAFGDWALYAVRRSDDADGRITDAYKGNVLYEAMDVARTQVFLSTRYQYQGLDLDEPTLFETFNSQSGTHSHGFARAARPKLGDLLEPELHWARISGPCTLVELVEAPYRTRQSAEYAKGAGHTFTCRRVTLRFAPAENEGAACEVVAWFAPEVKGRGLVALRARGRGRTFDLEVWGYGTKTETLFGTPRELVKFKD